MKRLHIGLSYKKRNGGSRMIFVYWLLAVFYTSEYDHPDSAAAAAVAVPVVVVMTTKIQLSILVMMTMTTMINVITFTTTLICIIVSGGCFPTRPFAQ